MAGHVVVVGEEELIPEEGVLEVPGDALDEEFGVGCEEECLYAVILGRAGVL